jgi:hypothetical protein
MMPAWANGAWARTIVLATSDKVKEYGIFAMGFINNSRTIKVCCELLEFTEIRAPEQFKSAVYTTSI